MKTPKTVAAQIKAIKKRRLALGWSQRRLTIEAENCCTSQTVKHLEDGTVLNPRALTLEAINLALEKREAAKRKK